MNADAVVDGDLRRLGDHLAVTVQVNRSADGFHILSRVFEGKAGELSRIDAELAAPVLAVLRPGLRAAGNRPPDPEAWALVLKARALRGSATLETFNRSVELLNEALRRDPQYSVTWGSIANLYAAASVNLHLDETTAANMAKSAAREALEFDPASASGWAAQGFVDAMVFLDWKKGEEELRRALALEPQDAVVHNRLSNILLLTGRFTEALKEGRIAEELDPLTPNSGVAVGLAYFMERRYDLALAQWSKLAALHPDLVMLHSFTGSALEGEGEYAKAMAEYELVAPRFPQAVEPGSCCCCALGAGCGGETAACEVCAIERRGSVSLAVIYGALGIATKRSRRSK